MLSWSLIFLTLAFLAGLFVYGANVGILSTLACWFGPLFIMLFCVAFYLEQKDSES